MIGCWMNMHSVLVSASTLGITLPGNIRESVFSLIIKSSTSSSSSSSSVFSTWTVMASIENSDGASAVAP